MAYTDYSVEDIHESMLNGNLEQMVNQIDNHGMYFWERYKEFLINAYDDTDSSQTHAAFNYFTNAVIYYFRLKGK